MIYYKVVVIDIRDVKGGSSATPRIINLRGCIHSKENNYPSRSLVRVAKPFLTDSRESNFCCQLESKNLNTVILQTITKNTYTFKAGNWSK